MCVKQYVLERAVPKLQLKTCKQMAVGTIFVFIIFFRQFLGCGKSHLTLIHRFCGSGEKWDLKDKLMSLDPLVSFIVPLGEVEAVAQRD